MKTKFNGILTLLLAFVVQLSFAQEKTISGTVVDETNMPLPGATVVIKGTTTGTSTDFDGNYSITANTGDVLTFSYVGYANQDATVGASNKINISLSPDNTLEEVVVTAVGIKRKQESITSSYDVVKTEELTQANNPDAVSALTGKVSGLQINQTSSGVNGSTRIVVRGNRSVTGNNQALVVIDNVISTAQFLRQLPPSSIKSVNVLKGAQGAALYGSQGVNGVIIVETKGGNKDGKITVEVNSSIDFQEVVNLPERQTTYGQGWQQDNGFDFGDGQGASYLIPWENGGWGPAFNDPRYAGQSWPSGLPQADGSFIMAPWEADNDNIKDFFRTGTILQNNATVTLGNAESFATVSVGRVNSNFVVDGDELGRTTFGLKVGKTIGKLTVGSTVNYNTENLSQSDDALYADLLQTATNIPVSKFSHGINEHHWTVYYKSPYWKQKNIREDGRIDYISASFDLNYKFNDHISAIIRPNVRVRAYDRQLHSNAWDRLDYDYTNALTNAGYTYYGSNSETYSSLSGGTPINSYYYGLQSSFRNIYNDILINFNYDLSEKIGFSATVGNNITDRKYRATEQGGSNLEIPGWYHINNVLNPDTPSSLTNNEYTRSRSYAFFANVDLSYEDYLFLNLTSRYEKTSVINDGFFYPSAGVSFVPTKAFESLSGGKVLSSAKVYANAVKVGNIGGVDPYDTFEKPTVAQGFPFGNIASLSINQTPTNAEIEPEFVTSYEAGLNLEFFKSRITLDAAIYQQDTDNLITSATTSTGSGVRRFQTNIGSLENKGFEVDLGLTPIRNDNFEWTIGASYATNKTTITKLTEDSNSVNLQSNGWVGIFAEVGEEFPLIKGTAYQRDPNGNIIVGSNGTPLRTSSFQKLGKATPDYILGFNTSFAYKGIRLNAVMDYRTGHQFYSGTKRELMWSGHTQESAAFDRDAGYVVPGSVQETSPGVFTPNTQAVEGGGYSGVIDYYSNVASQTGEGLVLDATAFKIREVALSYDLPSKMVEQIGLTGLTFGVSARNLYSSFAKENENFADPEASNTTGNAQGVANVGRYPSTRTYGFNLKLTF